jgi:carbonic anhydrase/acetyltransferase-like protein (isoleucine patch superfamily)
MAIYELDGVRPELPASGRCWIAENATVIGRVRLGDDVGVWFNAVLRGDNDLIAIGDRSNVQDGCVLHVDAGYPIAVGQDCVIGHNAVLHGCTLEDGVLIGMGATVLNGAVIGAHSLVGANALVGEGKSFPPYSLIVGAPARVVRTLDPEQAAGIVRGAAAYVEKRALYARALKRIG